MLLCYVIHLQHNKYKRETRLLFREVGDDDKQKLQTVLVLLIKPVTSTRDPDRESDFKVGGCYVITGTVKSICSVLLIDFAIQLLYFP